MYWHLQNKQRKVVCWTKIWYTAYAWRVQHFTVG